MNCEEQRDSNEWISGTLGIFVFLCILALLGPPVLAAPTVSTIYPSVGPNTSVSLTNITGTGFSSGATVRITNEIFNLTHKGKISKPGTGTQLYQVQVSGNYAYIANNGGNALEIVSVSNPAAPTHTASLINNTGGAILYAVTSVFVSGNYAYLTPGGGTSNAGLEIVNITDPTTPVHAGYLSNGSTGAVMNYPTSVFVSGNYAYVTGRNTNSLEIVNVTNKSAPVHAGVIVNGTNGALLASPECVVVSGNYAYVASKNSNALEIVDVTNKTAPVHAGSITDGQGGAMIYVPQAVAVQGNYAYIGSGDAGTKNGLEIVNISDPTHPVHAAKLPDGQDGAKINAPNGLFVAGSFVYIANNDGKLSVVDVSDPENPRHEAYISDGTGGAVLSNPWSVWVSDHYAYVSSGSGTNGALEIVDLGSTTWAPKGYSTGINVASTTLIDAGTLSLASLPEGTYNVVVINPDGTQGVVNLAFTILNAPPASGFTGTPTSGTAPLAVTFTDSSTGPGITSWNWSFGDAANTWYNTTNSSARNSTFTYTSAGTFRVNLTVTNATGSNTLSRANYITVSGPVTTTPTQGSRQAQSHGTTSGNYDPGYTGPSPTPLGYSPTQRIAAVTPVVQHHSSPVAAPVAAQTTTVPAAITSPAGFPLAPLVVGGAGIVVLVGGVWYTRRWWIRRQNPALFRKFD